MPDRANSPAHRAECDAIEADRWRWVHEHATLGIEHGTTAFTLRIDTGVQPTWKGDVDDVIDGAIERASPVRVDAARAEDIGGSAVLPACVTEQPVKRGPGSLAACDPAEIETLARQAGCTDVDLNGDRTKALERLAAFAALVRAEGGGGNDGR